MTAKNETPSSGMLLGVIGCGNVGYNTLGAFIKYGHSVKGYDKSEKAMEKIHNNFGEKSVATSITDLIECDLVFICVPTDPLENGKCDISILEKVVTDWVKLEDCDGNRCVALVQRSTCPPGTAQKMSRLLKKTGYAVNPSFLCKATQWENSIYPERIAIGSSESAIIEMMKNAYSNFPDCPTYITKNMSAVELIKYAENCMDAVLISLWNEFLQIAYQASVGPDDFIGLCQSFTDRNRFSTCLRVPGKPFGLWCLPKDIMAILNEFNKTNLPVLNGAIETNESFLLENEEGKEPSAELYGFDSQNRIFLTDSGESRIRNWFHSNKIHDKNG
jgi:UDPglucose 6-dehydrogenase